MILMLAPAPSMAFGAMPSGASYVSDDKALIYVWNNSGADQAALFAAGCSTLTPFGGWGNLGFATLADLYSADTVANIVINGVTGFPLHVIASIFNDTTSGNNGTWVKNTSGYGSGHWAQVSTLTLAEVVSEAQAAATEAEANASYASGSAVSAAASVGAAAAQAEAAAASAYQAAINAAAAETAPGPTYSSIEAGLAATAPYTGSLQSFASNAAAMFGSTFRVDNGNGTVSVYLNSNGTAVWLSSLATTASLALASGAGLVGFNPATNYPAGTVGAGLQSLAISATAMGAKADAWTFTDGVITSGNLSQISFTNVGWKPSAVTVGNLIAVLGAGPSGGILVTTIAAASGNTITLATPASQAVTGASGDFGTNDRAAIIAAINLAVSLGVGRVDFGDNSNTYLVGGAFDSGIGIDDIWTYADGSTRPFPRGLIPLPVNAALTLTGNGATFLLAPGYTDPGSLFYAPFWLGQTRDLTVEGSLRFNGNWDHQIHTAVAAGNDGYIWQHGAAIAYGGGVRIKVRHCEIWGWYHGVYGYGVKPAANFSPDDFLIEHNNFHDNMVTAWQTAASKSRSFDNWYHGGGGWVSVGFDIESSADDGEGYTMWDITSLADRFDCRDGFSTVYATVQAKGSFAGFDSNSAEALAARIHYRRCISISNDIAAQVNTGMFGNIHIIAPKIWQGYIEMYGLDNVHIQSPIIRNTIVEDVSDFALVTGNAIDLVASYYGNASGYSVASITDADIDHSGLAGRAVGFSYYEAAKITGRIKGGGLSPVHLENCGGQVDVRVVNGGKITNTAYWEAIYPTFDAPGIAKLIGMESAAVSVFGSIAPIDIRVQASEQRTGSGRQLETAAFINASTYPVSLTIVGDDGILSETYTPAAFTGVIAGGVLTVSDFASGTPLAPGQIVSNGSGTCMIVSPGTGTGGNGTYNVYGQTTVASGEMTTIFSGYIDRNGVAAVVDLSTPGTFNVMSLFKPTGGFQAHNGHFAITSDNGDLNIDLTAPTGQSSNINFLTTTTGGVVYAGQIQHGANGSLQVNMVNMTTNPPTATGTPIILLPDGSIEITGGWRNAVNIAGIGYLWLSEAEEASQPVLRVMGSAPTGDTDGVAVGSQT